MLDRSTNFFDDDAPTSAAVGTAGDPVDGTIATGSAGSRGALDEQPPPTVDHASGDGWKRSDARSPDGARRGRGSSAPRRPRTAAGRRGARRPRRRSAIAVPRSAPGRTAAAITAGVALVLVTIALADAMGVGARPRLAERAVGRPASIAPRPRRAATPSPTVRASKRKRSRARGVRSPRRHSPPHRTRSRRLKRPERHAAKPPTPISAVVHAAAPRPASPVPGAVTVPTPAPRAAPTHPSTPRPGPAKPTSEFGVEG
jgi:hypothetical protein